MVGIPAAYKKAIQSLWTGLATVTVRQGVLNPANGRTEPVEKVTASGLPCRISHQTVKSTEPTDEAALVAQTVTRSTLTPLWTSRRAPRSP